MSDLEALDESVEAETRKITAVWVVLGAITGALGAGYLGYSLLIPGEAAARPKDAAHERSLSVPHTARPGVRASGTSAVATPAMVAPSEPGMPFPSGPVVEEGSDTAVDGDGRDGTSTAALAGGQSPPVEYATDGAFFIQVASYQTKGSADERAKGLTELGLPAQVFAYGGPSAGWWHAVRVGPFETRADAEASRFKLRSGERSQSYVLPRANGKYHVQVGSFAKEEQAHQVAKSFAGLGHATKISRVRMAGQRWYCVRIGPFDTREEALGYQPLVKDIPGGKSEVIPFPPPPSQK